ncbi:hypothetical protein [Streptococcus ruminantium]|uniref:hypothetical protein n=1 Tax=Streptococcus ruminantium TaxID=1917441 RepID=UPI0012DD2766|nr:hypothetical protein [Streptococcus ruminantium]
MELVLPNNYVALEEEEMMYLDGGSPQNLIKNIQGLIHKTGLSMANRIAAGLPSTITMAKWGYWTAMAYFPGVITKLSALTGNPIIIGLAGLGATAAVYHLWHNRVFY